MGKCQPRFHDVGLLKEAFIIRSSVLESGAEPRSTLLTAPVALASETAHKAGRGFTTS